MNSPASTASCGFRPLSDAKALSKIAGYAAKNKVLAQMIGASCYDAVTPLFLPQYSGEPHRFLHFLPPYQAEISQGRLESSAELQNTVMELTGLEICLAWMGLPAVAERPPSYDHH